MSEMGKRIKQKRKECNLTQGELGAKLGIQASAVAKWEKGRVNNIKRDTIAKLSTIFNCSPIWLMGYDNEEDDSEYSIQLLNKINRLSYSDKKIVESMVDRMLENPSTT